MDFFIGLLLGYAMGSPSQPSPPLTPLETAVVVLSTVSVFALLVGYLFNMMRRAL